MLHFTVDLLRAVRRLSTEMEMRPYRSLHPGA